MRLRLSRKGIAIIHHPCTLINSNVKAMAGSHVMLRSTANTTPTQPQHCCTSPGHQSRRKELLAVPRGTVIYMHANCSGGLQRGNQGGRTLVASWAAKS